MRKRLAPAGDGNRGWRVLVASADPRVRAWARDCLPVDASLCAFADDSSVVADVARADWANLCLLDLRLPGDALAAVRELSESAPAVRIVAWAPSDDVPELVEAVDAGAIGCVAGEPDRGALARALDDILAGRPALPRAVVARLVAQLRGPSS